ncbi:phosphonate ABC transporter, substrate-binding protein [Escherichia coli]|nr:phosphonate ABC transporter, substrate-binding protein [Escherichia coli]
MNAKIIASLAFTSMFSLSTLLNPAYAEEQEKALNFGIISTESQQNLKPQWTPFLQDMEKKLGVKVNAFFAPDYAGIIQGMRFNKVDIAWYGNLSAMEAVDRANGQVFAQTVAADGSPGYWSVLIVNKDSPINNLNDLLAKRKDLTFGNGDPNSTSGFLVPVTTSSLKTISPPATLSAPSTPGMKPTPSPSLTSKWMSPPTTPKTSTS